MKRRSSKEENKLKQRLPNSIERGRKGWEFCLEEFWPFIAFFMLQIRFSNHRLIKITIIHLYIKPEVKKNDTTAMTAAISEACIGRLYENCYLVRVIFSVQEMRQDSPIYRVFPNSRFWGKGRAVHTWWNNKQNERRWNIFGKMVNIVGIL